MDFADVYDRTIGFLTARKRAYQIKFPDPAEDDLVLQDLMQFTGYTDDVRYKDPVEAAYWAGRRSVVTRIVRHRKWTVDKLFDIYSGMRPQNPEERK